jgi:hypothetical protein
MALSLVDKSESRERGEARQRDHEQMCDLLAGLLTAFVVEEGRQSARSMVPNPLALLSPALVNQVSSTTILYVCDSNVCITTYSRIHKTLYLSRHQAEWLPHVPDRLIVSGQCPCLKIVPYYTDPHHSVWQGFCTQ